MKHVKQSTLITLAAIAFLVGLILGRHAVFPLWPVLIMVMATIITWRSRWRGLVITLLCLSLGAWRAGVVNHADKFLTNLYGQKVTVVGTVRDDPSVNDKNQLSYSVSTSHIEGQRFGTNMVVYTYRTPLKRGQTVSLTGKLKPARGSNRIQMSFPKMIVLSDKLSWLEKVRLKYFAAVRATIPEPLASFALGLLVGARALIPKAMAAQLSAVGLSHLVAVSGYNLTILVEATKRWLGKSGKFFTLALSLWLIAGFVLVAGASASIVRAAVVSVLSLLASYYGRNIKPTVLITLAAALTAGFNPHSLYGDLGWQLSFMAFAGILIVAPAIAARFRIKNSIALLALEATIAYLITLPLILHTFGTFTPIAPLTNLLVVPLVPFAMLGSFLSGVAGMIVPSIAGWISWPAVLLLRFMIGIVEQGARIQPGSSYMTTRTMVLWYAFTIAITYLAVRGTKKPTWYNNNKGKDNVRTLKVA